MKYSIKMGFWNSATKIGRKFWRGGKAIVSNAYEPFKQIVSTVHKGANFVDGLLNKAVDFGAPASLVDLIRENPIYGTIKGTIDTVGDLVERDLPKFGNVVNDFVEGHLLSDPSPRTVGDVVRGVSTGRDILQQGSQLIGNIQDIGNRASVGFTPNRNPTSRGFIPFGAG